MPNMRFTKQTEKIRSSMLNSVEEVFFTYFDEEERAEAEKLIHAIQIAESEDEREPNKAKLKRICDGYDIDMDKLLANPEKILQSIPTKQQMIDKMLEYFHSLYQIAPTPEQNITRITDRLIKTNKYPEFKKAPFDEPTRVKILRRLTAGCTQKCKTFKTQAVHEWAFDRMTERDRKKYLQADDAKKAAMAAVYINDEIFENMNAVQLDSADKIRLMSEFATKLKLSAQEEPAENTEKFNDINIDVNTLSEIKNFCMENGIIFTDSNHLELICIIADSIGNIMTRKEFNEKTAYFWDSLEEQFDQTMKSAQYTLKKGKTRQLSPAFKKWKNCKKDEIKKLNKSWKILRFCHKMAKGSFQSDVKTNRRNLYHYAILFNMTCDIGEVEVRKNETDISKNLFEDFYCDNMLRFFDKSDTSNEAEPSGEGINYKNFTDVIYIYFLLNNREELPGKRIDDAEKLIKRCIENRKDDKNIQEEYKRHGATNVFRTTYAAEAIEISQKDLEKYIISHFLIPRQIVSMDDDVIISNTANEKMNEAMKNIDKIWSNIAISEGVTDQLGKPCLKKVKRDASVFKQIMRFNKMLISLLEEKYGEDKNFMAVIDRIVKRIESFEDILPYQILRASCLKILYFAQGPILQDDFTKEVSKDFGLDVDGRICNKIIDDLTEAGFDISVSTQTEREKHRENKLEPNDMEKSINRKTGTFYGLNKREYPENPILADIIKNMPPNLNHNTPDIKRKFIESVKRLQPERRKISRSRLLTTAADAYILGLDMYDTLSEPDFIQTQSNSAQKILENFCFAVNGILTDSNFQPVNAKNLLDMYLFLSALCYFKF